MHDITSAADTAAASAGMRAALADSLPAPSAVFEVVCIGPDGEEKWRETVRNLVTTAGKTDIVDKYLKGSAYTAAWFGILAGSGTKAVGDTLASHAGWTEITAYTGSRPAITWGTTSAGSNTSSTISYSMNGAYTVAGIGISSVASGTSGTLYNVGDFAAARTGASGDTLNVTITLSVS